MSNFLTTKKQLLSDIKEISDSLSDERLEMITVEDLSAARAAVAALERKIEEREYVKEICKGAE
jgi:predicted amino acid-binding ACT domain protein